MKNRILSLALTLALALSLAVPALAANEVIALPADLVVPDASGYLDYGLFEAQFLTEYAAAHPEEYAAFDAEAWCRKSWGVSKKEYMSYMEVDEAGFREEMWQDYLYEQASAAYNAREVEAYRAAHPGELEGLDLDKLLAAEGYREPWTAYMEDAGYPNKEAAQTALLCRYVEGRNYVAETHAQAEAYRATDPESWETFDGDAYYADEYGYYWDSKEKYMGLNSLLTDEEFADYLYVDYMESNSWNEPIYRPSTAPLTLLVNGEPMEAPLTAADGVTYVPADTANALFDAHFTTETVALRAAAEANGYDVVWNAGRNQVVLLDKATLLAGMEEEFAALDDFFARLLAVSLPEAGQGYRYTETCDIALTAFNSLDGDKTYTAKVKADMLVKDNVYDMTLTVGVADLLGLLNQATLEKLTGELPKLTLKDLKSLLTGIELNLIMDLNTGTFSWNAPILAAFDETITEDTWYTVSAGEDFSALLTGEWSTGELLYNVLLSESEGGWSAEYAYYSFESSRDALALLFGADAFTEKGGALTWKLDAAAVNDMMAQLTGAEAALFKEYNLSISVSESGKFTCSAALRLDTDALAAMATGDWADAATTAAMSWVMGLLDFRVTARSEGTADRAAATAEFHWKNQFSLDMESKITRAKTTAAPRVAPPESAELIDLNNF